MLQESVGNHRFNVKYDDMLKIDEAELLKGQIATKWDDPEGISKPTHMNIFNIVHDT